MNDDLAIAPEHLQTETHSPFLPGTYIQYAWDSTSLGYLKTCPRLYQYQMIEGWSTPGDNVHLRFGAEYHSTLEDYERQRAEGMSHEDALHLVVYNLMCRTADFAPDPNTKAGKYKSRNALIRSVIYYLDDHRDDPAKTYIMENGQPAVELSFRFELDWGPKAHLPYIEELGPVADFVASAVVEQPYLLCGHLDRVVEFSGALFVMDHKTTTTTPGDYFFDGFDPNNQMSLYTLAGKMVLATPIKGVIINAAQLLIDGYGDTRFKRGFTHRTQDRLDEWLDDLRYWLGEAERFAVAGYWPQNDTSCDKFGGCKFREVCSKSPQVRETYLKSNFVQLPLEERWNPLKPR